MSSEATYAMSPNSSLAGTLSHGHTGCKGAWEVSVWSKGMGRPRQPLAASKKREQLLKDWPAKAATAIVQTLEAAPLFPVCRGQWKETAIVLDFQPEQWWQWAATRGLVWDSGGSRPRCPRSPAQAPALPGPVIRQPGAGANDTPDCPLPPARAQTHRVSWSPGYHTIPRRDETVRPLSQP